MPSINLNQLVTKSKEIRMAVIAKTNELYKLVEVNEPNYGFQNNHFLIIF